MKIENTQILLFFISINQKKMSYLQKSNPKIKVNVTMVIIKSRAEMEGGRGWAPPTQAFF